MYAAFIEPLNTLLNLINSLEWDETNTIVSDKEELLRAIYLLYLEEDYSPKYNKILYDKSFWEHKFDEIYDRVYRETISSLSKK